MGDAGEPEVDFTKLPIDERIQHKNWKARVSGYESLVQLFSTQDEEKSPEFTKYVALVKKFPVDSNAAAQEKGLAAVYAFVEYSATAISGRIASDIVSGIINKCLLSSKVKTKELAQAIVLMYIEAEKHEVVAEELLKGLENKSPKIVSACIALMRDSLNSFGPKVIKPSPLIKIVLQKLEDRDKQVRDETKQLAVEIYRWMKEAFKMQLQGLKPVQLTELEAEFVKVQAEKAQPTRFLRSDQVRVQPVSAGAVDEGDGAAQSAPIEEDVDPYELLEPVEILSKLPGDFYEQCEAKKWQERKQALETLQELLTPNPKLATGDYGELIKTLKKFISKDTNVMVVALATKCLADLASRLRKAFHSAAHSCVVIILEKFKEKKQNVVTALRDAIDAVMLSTNLEAIQEDVVAALDNKNPQIKTETGSFLTRQFSILTPTVMSNKKLLKVLVAALVKALNDMDGGVRDAAAEAIGTCMKVTGEKLMNPFLADVDAIKLGKIKEYYEKATVKYPAPAGGHQIARGPPPKQISAASLPPKSGPSSPMGSTEDIPSKRAPLKSGSKVVAKPRTDTGVSGLKKGASSSSAPVIGSKTGPRPKTGPAGSKAVVRGRASIGAMGAVEEKSATGSLPTLPLNNLKETRLADEKALRVLKWNFTVPREEYPAQLKEQMINANWGAALIANCFHVDFKFHLKALAEMTDFLVAGNTEATLANSDLILKWTSLRFFDTNPSVILKCLEYLLLLFGAYQESNEQILEVDAQSFFPYLILKTGDPKDVVRNKVHDILVKAKEVYPPTKLFALVMNGLGTKNSRQRSCCLDELANLIEGYGLGVCQPPHPAALKEIAKQLSDRDNGVRNSALNCVIQVYYIEGERVTKQVGKLSDKDMDFLNERIKRVAKNRPPPKAEIPQAPAGRPATAPGIPPPSSRNTTPPKERSPPKTFAPSNTRTPSPEEDDEVPTYNPKSAVSKGGTITKRKTLRPISLNVHDIEQQIHDEVTSPSKPISHILHDEDGEPLSVKQQLANRRRANQAAALRAQHQQQQLQMQRAQEVESVEDLLSMPDVQLPERRTSINLVGSPVKGSQGSVARMVASSPQANVALNMMMSQLTAHEIPTAIEAYSQLHQLLDRPDHAETMLLSKVDQIILMCNMQYRLCITKHITDDNTPRSQVIALFKSVTSILDGLFKHPTLKKQASREVLQELMPQVISIILDQRLTEGQEGPAVIRSVNILATCIIINADPTNMMSALIRLLSECVRGSHGNSNSKFTEMVMKCIWKMVRFIEQYIGELNLDKVLFDIHLFMKEFPSEFWKSDTSRVDTPLRTVKTITFLLAQQKGASINDHLSLITDTNASELVAYIQRALKNIEKDPKDGVHNSAAKAPQFGSAVKSSPVKSAKPAESEVAIIIERLEGPESTQAFADLSSFMQSHPDFDLDSHLQSNSPFFRDFVRNGLAKFKASSNGSHDENHGHVNGNGLKANGHSKQEGDLVADAGTPKLPPRSRLGNLSTNAVRSIPAPSSSRNYSVPAMPPADQLHRGEAIEWLKQATAMIGKDPSKYDDPSKLEQMRQNLQDKYKFTNNTNDDLLIARRMAEDAKESLRLVKKKYNVTK